MKCVSDLQYRSEQQQLEGAEKPRAGRSEVSWDGCNVGREQYNQKSTSSMLHEFYCIVMVKEIVFEFLPQTSIFLILFYSILFYFKEF